MDSLTQFILGASVGEVVLGKKIGNRAMIWGGIAGTIPDLDVLSSYFLSEIDTLASHRGLSHSICFSILGGFFFGWLLYNIYKSKFFDQKPSLRDWQWLFFWCFITHVLLDCFTSYGTQVFAPFSDYRLAFGNISVADPMYTLPFLVCLIVAGFFRRGSLSRKKWNYAGIIISSIYMLFTIVNKQFINNFFKEELKRQGISYSKFQTTPTILNNQLWFCIVEQDSVFLHGHYSAFDKEKKVTFIPIDKNHDWIEAKPDDHTINTLKWFSNGFYNVIKKADGGLQINDLRFGTFNAGDKPEDNFVFRFQIEKNKKGGYDMFHSDGGPKKGDEKQMLDNLYIRWKGI